MTRPTRETIKGRSDLDGNGSILLTCAIARCATANAPGADSPVPFGYADGPSFLYRLFSITASFAPERHTGESRYPVRAQMRTR